MVAERAWGSASGEPQSIFPEESLVRCQRGTPRRQSERQPQVQPAPAFRHQCRSSDSVFTGNLCSGPWPAEQQTRASRKRSPTSSGGRAWGRRPPPRTHAALGYFRLVRDVFRDFQNWLLVLKDRFWNGGSVCNRWFKVILNLFCFKKVRVQIHCRVAWSPPDGACGVVGMTLGVYCVILTRLLEKGDAGTHISRRREPKHGRRSPRTSARPRGLAPQPGLQHTPEPPAMPPSARTSPEHRPLASATALPPLAPLALPVSSTYLLCLPRTQGKNKLFKP